MAYTPMQLAEAFIQTGELADALDALNQHLDANSADDVARRLLIQVLMRISDKSSIPLPLAEFGKLAELTADDYAQKSIVLQRMNRQIESSAALAQAHAMRPDDERITENYMRALIRSRDYDTALALLEHLPRKWGWLRYAGEIAMQREHFDLALRHYSAAVDELDRLLTANHNPILVNMKVGMMSARADIYLRIGQFDTAEAEYVMMEMLEPTNVYFTLWRGLCIALDGDLQRAYPIVAGAIASSSSVRDDFRDEIMQDPRLEPFARLFDTPTA